MIQFEFELRKLIAENLLRLRETLENPSAINQIEQYKFIAGQIFAYRRLLDHEIDEINTAVNKG